MKKFRFLSALTFASAIVSGVAGVTLAAGNTDWTGVLKQGSLTPTVTDKDVVGYLLTDKNDTVTVDDILALGGYTSVKLNGETAEGSAIVKTGDYYTEGNKKQKRHVVVYNEVNKDGKVTTDDIKYTLKMIVNPNEGEDLQREAADVKHDGKVSTDDVKRMLKFQIGAVTTPVDPKPVPEVQDTMCTVELTDQYVNNRNEEDVPVTIKMNTVLTESINAKIVKIKDDGTYDETAVVDDITLNKNMTEQGLGKTFDCSDLDEGKTTLKLIAKEDEIEDEDQEVLATFTVDKHTDEISNAKLTQVKPIRDNTKEASISFATIGDNIVKIYYANETDKAPLAGYKTDKSTATDEELSKLKSLDITDNKVENQKVYTDLTTGVGAKLYYVLVDEYGSIKVEDTTAIEFAKDGDNDSKVTMKDVTIDSLEGKTDYSDVNVTWTLESGDGEDKTFVVTLYKDGTPVAEQEVSDKLNENMTTLGFDTIMKEEAGTYTVSVYVKATANENPSNAVSSSSGVTVEQLKAVTDVTFAVNEEGQKVLTWKSDYAKEDIKGYKVEVVEIQDGVEQTAHQLNNNKEVIDPSYIIGTETTDSTYYTDNKIHKAIITVIPKDGLAQIASETTKSKEFFTIGATTVSQADTPEITTNSVKLKIDPLITIGDKTTTYKVEVWEKTGDSGLDAAKYKNTGIVKTVTPLAEDTVDGTGKAGEFVVDGLQPGHTYIFKMIVDVEGIQGVSGFVPDGDKDNGITILNELPSLSNLKVLADDSETVAEGQIAKITSGTAGLNIAGTKIETTDFGKYSDGLQVVYDLIGTTDVETGDVITYTPEKLTITLANAQTRTFTAKVKDMVVEVNGSTKDEIKIKDSGSDLEIKELILNGSDSTFDISEFTTEDSDTKITVQNGITIKTKTQTDTKAVKLTIAAGANVTVDGVKIATEKEIAIATNNKADAVTINVTEDNTAAQNNLTFENTNGVSVGAIINFEGKDNESSRLDGTITLVSKGAKISIKHTNMSIDSKVNVTVENGEVDISDDSFTGAKTVNVTVAQEEDAKLTVTPAKDIPTFLSAEIEDYVLKDIADVTKLKDDPELSELTSDLSTDEGNKKAQELKEFLDSFGLNGKGVKLSTDKDNNKVTLQFTKPGTYTLTSEANGIK